MKATEEPNLSTELVKLASDDSLSTWTDDKRREFTKIFEDRAGASRYIMYLAALKILEGAYNKKFISNLHLDKFQKERDDLPGNDFVYRLKHCMGTLTDLHRFATASDVNHGQGQGYEKYKTIGGRDIVELDQLAHERSRTILEELPPLKQAVKVIDPTTAKKIDRRDALLVEGKAMVERLEILCQPIRMADLDQNMTIGAFRKSVKVQDKKKRELVHKLDEIGAEGSELDDEINTALYRGLPGLSDAVLSVAKDHFERSTALAQTTRRVVEQVQFGDSHAALELLRGFEKDELKVSEKIKAEFSTAMKKLHAAKKRAA